ATAPCPRRSAARPWPTWPRCPPCGRRLRPETPSLARRRASYPPSTSRSQRRPSRRRPASRSSLLDPVEHFAGLAHEEHPLVLAAGPLLGVYRGRVAVAEAQRLALLPWDAAGQRD